MEASIVGEDDKGVGVDIVDNDDEKHHVGMDLNGQIRFHDWDTYPEKPEERSSQQSELINQARRFAQYYVYCERGYDTVPSRIHPERINAVRLAVAQMDLEAFEANFGDLYQQLKSHHDEDYDRVVQLPADAQSEDLVLYRKNVYLGLDPLETEFEKEARTLAERYGLDLTDRSPSDLTLGSLSPDELDSWSAYSDDLAAEATDAGVTLYDGLYIDGVSELHMAYLDHRGEEHVTTALEPEVEPDTRIELPPADPGTLEQFKAALEFNLICQIRDCFVRMGVQPPEEYQVLGLGTFEAAEKYETVDFYPEYHMPEDGDVFLGDTQHSAFFGSKSVLGTIKSLLG